MQRWLQDCRDRHHSCKIGSATILPTRVIDVGTSPDDTRLYVSQGEEGSYAALSHCWGGHTPVTTTRDTLECHKRSLRFDSQSKTFADAVEVTRSLGLQYLWVDSLCIIQDDADDWTAESAKMSEVYRNATITFSADGADNASGGLFGSLSFRTLAHKVYSIETEGLYGELIMVYARLRSTRPSDPDSSPHSSHNTRPSNLSTRAWVVQERILSPRIVHFHKEELVWSCYGQQRCECRLIAGASSSGTFRRLLASKGSSYDLLLEWPKLVSQFTAKGLTFAKDRLPAISGLATLMHQHTLSRYMCGLWSGDMDYSLLWMSDHERAKDTPIQRMPDKPYAPSWSWASVVGPIRYIDRHLDQLTDRRSGEDEIKPIFRTLSVTTTPATSNIYGAVNRGLVTIEGQVLPIRYDGVRRVWRPSSQPSQPWNNGSGLTIIDPAEGRAQDPLIEPKFVLDVLSESPELYSGAPAFEGFALLRAATYIWGGACSTPTTEVVALFLAQISEEPIIYKRLGIALHAFNSQTTWSNVATTSVVLC